MAPFRDATAALGADALAQWLHHFFDHALADCVVQLRSLHACTSASRVEKSRHTRGVANLPSSGPRSKVTPRLSSSWRSACSQSEKLSERMRGPFTRMQC